MGADGPARAPVQGAAMPKAQDAFRREDEHWFATEKKFYRVVRSQPPAVITFSYVDRPELVDDFLKPHRRAGPRGRGAVPISRSIGASRMFDWALEGQEGKSIALPESDLKVTLSEATEFPTSTGRLDRFPGRRPGPDRRFQDPVGQGRAGHPHGACQLADGAQRDSFGGPVRPSPRRRRWRRSITWSRRRSTPRPTADSGRSTSWPGRTRRSITASSAEARRAARASFAPPGRSKRESRSSAFGGGANMPMTITFQVDKYLPAGDREADLRAGRASQGPDGQRHRRLPGRDDRRRRDQGSLAEPFGKPRSAACATRDVSATRPTKSFTTSIEGRWASS